MEFWTPRTFSKGCRMGRIKSAMVKRATFELMRQDIEFSYDFERNKKLLKNTMPSKKVRNKIAGYIARLKKSEKNSK